MPRGKYDRKPKPEPTAPKLTAADSAENVLQSAVQTLQERSQDAARRVEWHRKNRDAYHAQFDALTEQGHAKFVPLFDSFIAVYVMAEIAPARFESVLNSALRELSKSIQSNGTGKGVSK